MVDVSNSGREKEKYFWERDHRIIKILSYKSFNTPISNCARKVLLIAVYQSTSKHDNIKHSNYIRVDI